MESEIEALQANNTWVEVDLPPRKKAISSKWVYKVKLKAYGSIERYKHSWSLEIIHSENALISQKRFHL